MADAEPRIRRVTVPSRGARISMLVGVVLMIASLYFFFAPLDRTLLNGIVVHCGSPVRLTDNADALVACAALPGQELAKGLVLLAVGLVLLLFSTLVFGSTVRVDVESGSEEVSEDQEEPPPGDGSAAADDETEMPDEAPGATSPGLGPARRGGSV